MSEQAQSQTWAKVCQFMQAHCAVVLRADQSYLLNPRLESTAKKNQFGSVDAFVAAAVVGPPASPLSAALIDAMTTHESYFFRDGSFWQFFESEILAKMLQRPDTKATVWCAACSTGQEPYSLAMLLEERWPSVARHVSILGTDVSQEAVESATRGVYSTTEVNRGLSAPRLMRHFVQVSGGFSVKPSLRERIRFQTFNLMAKAAPVTDCDIILCRNVLIYFSDADKKTVVSRLSASMRPGGFLGLGTSERCELPQLQPGWHQKPAN